MFFFLIENAVWLHRTSEWNQLIWNLVDFSYGAHFSHHGKAKRSEKKNCIFRPDIFRFALIPMNLLFLVQIGKRVFFLFASRYEQRPLLSYSFQEIINNWFFRVFFFFTDYFDLIFGSSFWKFVFLKKFFFFYSCWLGGITASVSGTNNCNLSKYCCFHLFLNSISQRKKIIYFFFFIPNAIRWFIMVVHRNTMSGNNNRTKNNKNCWWRRKK